MGEVPRRGGGGIKMVNMLAMDLGASNGRAIVGTLEDERIRLTEVHRFSNDTVTINGRFYFDVLRLFHEIKTGLLACKERFGEPDSMGIDTWGCTFGLLDKDGDLLGNVPHYRDECVERQRAGLNALFTPEELYSATGYYNISSLEMLFAQMREKPELFSLAKTYLQLPDLLGYFLTGVKTAEHAITSTTMFFDMFAHKWAADIMQKAGVDPVIFCEPQPPGTVLGSLTPALNKELFLDGKTRVMRVCGHDSAGAGAAVLSDAPYYAYMSCGTWSIFGYAVPDPKRDMAVLDAGFTYEFSLPKPHIRYNIMGLWIQQECKRHWKMQGQDHTYRQYDELAEKAPPFLAVIDPNDERFFSPGDMPLKIQRFCEETGQNVPKSPGEIWRVISESLALKYRDVLERAEALAGHRVEVFHMIGGGVQNEALCQYTADALDRKVLAGPVEGTVMGNFALQGIGLGVIRDLTHAREIIRRSSEVKEYLPRDKAAWDKAFAFAKTIYKQLKCHE